MAPIPKKGLMDLLIESAHAGKDSVRQGWESVATFAKKYPKTTAAGAGAAGTLGLVGLLGGSGKSEKEAAEQAELMRIKQLYGG